MTKNLTKLVLATIIYLTFALYLYHPYFKGFDEIVLRDLFVVNTCLASLGCFLISRRWITAFAGSFFAGAIYGFGPFMLGLAKFHPIAGTMAALVPWLFCPAVFGPKGKWRPIRILLALLPFLTIIFFFEITAHYRLFAIPIKTTLNMSDLAGLLAPLVAAERRATLIGFYHVPIAPLFMGLTMLLATRRVGIWLIVIIGVVLTFCPPVFNASPFFWMTFPLLCCSILIGIGMQAFVYTGPTDRKWIIISGAILAVLAIVTLLLATQYFQFFASLADKYAKLLVETAKMYILGAIAAAIIFFLARAKIRVHSLRWAILCSAVVVDILLTARFIIDNIF